MRKGYLSEYFSGVGYKRLSAVEAHRHRSNQHEFDGVGALRNLLGSERRTFPATFIYLSDREAAPVRDDGFLTWYDAREAHPTRTEFRLYFPDTAVSKCANERDLLVVALRPDGSLLVVIAEHGSTYENQMYWLFALGDFREQGFSIHDEAFSDQVRLEFASRYVLDQIGVSVETTDENHLEKMLEAFGSAFPSTRAFSAFARSTLPNVSGNDDADQVVIAWMEREELLFRTLERHLIADRLRKGFGDDVDAFVGFSLSVQNRRKARAGSALENHLESLFFARGIEFSRTAITEGRSKPDFLFPGVDAYHEPSTPKNRLTMLGVKSSCKDRWRQILAEAERIEHKHLLTLEPGISRNQTDEMSAKNVQLVLPKSLHSSYGEAQRSWLMDVSGFCELVERRQRAAGVS